MAFSSLDDLAPALRAFNWVEAESICKRLINEVNASTTPYPENDAKNVLKALRQKRQFRLMTMVADAFIRNGQSAFQVLRQYAQSLIDQGNLTASRAVLQAIIDSPDSESEKAEAMGLLGRVYKQMYVDANNSASPIQQKNLATAIEYYYSVYKRSPQTSLWHGINTVACIARAERDNVNMPNLPAKMEIVQEIEGLLKKIAPIAYWDRATAIENAVAMGNFNAAYARCLEYVLDQEADAFEIASTLRQLSEVWQLRPETEAGGTLLAVLKAALLTREGGVLRMDVRQITPEANYAQNAHMSLEKVFGTDKYQPLGWLKKALKRCEAVARVEDIDGIRVGTGFLVKSVDFFPGRDENELLFLTNAHVISPAGTPFPGAISPNTAKVVFEASSREYFVDKVVWSSPPHELDATFVMLKSHPQDTEFCSLSPAAEPFNKDKRQRVYVIGYPQSSGLSISLQDSLWLDASERILHYRTPTEPGSSGSPVFDQQHWTLIGLHHAGSREMPQLRGKGDYESNEGIAITAIQRATRTIAYVSGVGR